VRFQLRRARGCLTDPPNRWGDAATLDPHLSRDRRRP